MPTTTSRSTEHHPLRPPLCPTVASSSSTPRQCNSTTLPALALTTPPAPNNHSSSIDMRHHGQPTPASLRPSRPHPEHHAAEYFLPNRSDPAGDPYSELSMSFPHHRSPPLRTSLPGELLPPHRPKTGPPPYHLASRTRPATPRHQAAVHWRHGSKLPCLSVLGEMAKWARNP
jgi:hypothetical protein